MANRKRQTSTQNRQVTASNAAKMVMKLETAISTHIKARVVTHAEILAILRHHVLSRMEDLTKEETMMKTGKHSR